jgi:glycosyltransferase involved in cell wall biosynthesis
MRITLVHNFYTHPGGEDQVFSAEERLLRSYGHEVQTYVVHNSAIASRGIPLAVGAVWNQKEYAALRRHFRAHHTQIAHFHNTFPIISPAAYYAAHHEGVAVVQTLHNYRLTCVNGLLFRDGRPCEACIGKLVATSGVYHACYRKSTAASAVVAGTSLVHRAIGTYSRLVDRYITLTEFARDIMVRSGLPESKTVVKPNFMFEDATPGDGSGGYALFVGRLSEEKGVRTLLEAWRGIGNRVPLLIVGDGPLRGYVESAVGEMPGLKVLGQVDRSAVVGLMAAAKLLVFPSQWYEGFPMTLLEAMSVGTPVIASRIGGIPEIVEDGRTGLLFDAGEAADLANKVLYAVSREDLLDGLRLTARQVFSEKYTASANYSALASIYGQALEALRLSVRGSRGR